jgi:cell wall-associated NlpC family hydrolase
LKRFIYNPEVSVFVATMNHGTIDLSQDVISGSVHRVLDGVSTSTFTLQNPRNKYIKDKNGRPIFRSMDRVAIFLNRVKSMQVFAGYLDDVPYEQFVPGPVTLNASCSLKRLLYTWFDPSLVYTVQRLAEFGWIFDPNTGSLQDTVSGLGGMDVGGGLGQLTNMMLQEVGGWNANTIQISPLPPAFISKTVTAMTTQIKELQAQKDQADDIVKRLMTAQGIATGTTGTGGTGTGGGGSGTDTSGTTTSGTGYCAVLQHAYDELGQPYVWGGDSPGGFDCSGLIEFIFGKVGINLPQPAQSQYSHGTPVDDNNLLPGDLLFWGDGPDSIHHVALYIGGGKMIEAPRPGDKVKIYSVAQENSFFRWHGAKRIITGGCAGGPNTGGSGSGTTGSVGNTVAAHTKYSYDQLKQIWIQAGGNPDMADTMAAIALAESGGDVSAHNDNAATGDDSYGLWQINYYASLRDSRIAAYGNPNDLLTDPWKTAKAAIGISGNSVNGLNNWSTYKNKNPLDSHSYLYYLKPSTDTTPTPAPTGTGTGGGTTTPAGTEVDPALVNLGAPATVGTSAEIANSIVLGSSISFPTASGEIIGEVLTGARALYNDVQLMKWIETACTASGRRFQSLPNGDFMAFYPDYFGWSDDPVHSTPTMLISDLEIIKGDITLSDRELTTHYYATADLNVSGSIDFYDIMRSAVASVETIANFEDFVNTPGGFSPQAFPRKIWSKTLSRSSGGYQESYYPIPICMAAIPTKVGKAIPVSA